MKRTLLAGALALASVAGAQTAITPETADVGAEAIAVLPSWSVGTPWQLARAAQTGEPVQAQLRFAMPPEVSISFPCTLTEPPSIKVTPLREGGEDEAQWLTLEPIWDAPKCEDGALILRGGSRGQYRAALNGLPAGSYRLGGFWFGGKVGDLLGTPEQVLTLEE